MFYTKMLKRIPLYKARKNKDGQVRDKLAVGGGRVWYRSAEPGEGLRARLRIAWVTSKLEGRRKSIVSTRKFDRLGFTGRSLDLSGRQFVQSVNWDRLLRREVRSM